MGIHKKSLSSSTANNNNSNHGEPASTSASSRLQPLLRSMLVVLLILSTAAQIFRSVTIITTLPPTATTSTTTGVVEKQGEDFDSFFQQQQHLLRQQQQQFPPKCEELMKRPNSPFSDGAFLSRRSTNVHWRIRRDHSRELTLPNTCILKRYTSNEAKTCLRDRHLMFIGDSLSRYQYLSLAYFLEYDRWPNRFNAGMSATLCADYDRDNQQQQKNDDDDDDAACSSLPGQYPNVCSEGDWINIGGWPIYQQTLGGGDDGGIFHGRMESHSTRECKNEGENMQYITATDPVEMLNKNTDNNSKWKGRTKLSFTMEFGWDEIGIFSPGWNYTGCAYDGTCRYTQQQYENNIKLCEEGNDFDWQYPSILEAFGGTSSASNSNGNNNDHNETNHEASSNSSEEKRTNTVFQEQYPDVNYVFYNRGLWGKIPEKKASQMMSLLYNFTNLRGGEYGAAGEGDEDDSSSHMPKNRCFFKSTTGCGRSHGDGHYDHEYGMVRSAAFSAGCEYIDIGHLTREFASYLFAHPAPPRNVMSEYLTIFWDAVHYQPWVYEELNNLMLNVLCNAG